MGKRSWNQTVVTHTESRHANHYTPLIQSSSSIWWVIQLASQLGHTELTAVRSAHDLIMISLWCLSCVTSQDECLVRSQWPWHELTSWRGRPEAEFLYQAEVMMHNKATWSQHYVRYNIWVYDPWVGSLTCLSTVITWDIQFFNNLICSILFSITF